MMQQVFRFASAVISIYMVVIFIRILLTWFRGANLGRAEEILSAVTDPYLNWFRRHLSVQFGAFDFSPVVAILALGLVNNIATQLAFAGTITLGYVAAMLVSAVWSVLSFFITFFLILSVVRLVGLLGGFDGGGRIWSVLEQIINPVLQPSVRPLLRGRFTTYRDSLLMFSGILVAVWIVGRIATGILIALAQAIPF